MLADIVHITTTDGIMLSGAYFAPNSNAAPTPVDALVFFHGDGGNFYRPLYLDMGEYMAERGIAFLAANRRGHDHVSGGAPGGPLAGYAFESVSESPLDYAAWLDLLRERGHQRLAIGGHSGGAVRAVYSQAKEHFADVVAVVPVSPGEYNHGGLIKLHGEAFTKPFAQAEKDIAEDNPDAFLRPCVPWGSMWTARTFVDCFNPDNRYSVTTHATNTNVPAQFIFGSEECAGPQELPACGAARRSLESVSYPYVRVTVIDGANHGYVNRETQLMETIFDFLVRL